MPLILDDRECRGPLPDALAASGAFDVEIRRLALGDCLVDGALLFERKTLPDLAASIKEGRLFSQALRLARARWPAALVLEGTAGDLARSEMRWEAIQGALINVSLFIGLPILRSRSALETARTMLYAAEQNRAVVMGGLTRRGRRPKGKAALQSYILQGLPGVGPERAAQLLARFGSVEAVVSADAEVLTSVAGIGSQTARRLRWALGDTPGNASGTGIKPSSPYKNRSART
ncbi:MAG: hypothetical protein JWQ90_29 [Hydrocarboniphaga sp.]|uniref:ERCC4 domain-containing protein n=1 Tax=Hydrocarboniphaga sp. TaxID=2033016 RepID=UPI00261D3A32|nr:ERCC4 domain-containing protein [Hydrocarboniphaga sp.]MDB5967579.1 hypothetical protein [Hydrocarboniphaga sp.]